MGGHSSLRCMSVAPFDNWRLLYSAVIFPLVLGLVAAGLQAFVIGNRNWCANAPVYARNRLRAAYAASSLGRVE